MDLILSGMALSYQWWPSIAHFEESLANKRKPSPAMVEQAGEVIFQALTEARPADGSKLSIIYDPDQVEIGPYLSLLKKDFGTVDQVKPASQSMLSRLRQAAVLIQADNRRLVVICELSSSGSAAVVLSSSENNVQAYAKLKFSDSPDPEPSRADYVVLTEAPASEPEKTVVFLQELFQDRENDLPAALGCSSPASALSSEILTLIQAVISIKNKFIPSCGSDIDLISTKFAESPLYPINEIRPWLSRGPDYSRSALILFKDQDNNETSYVVLEETEHSESSPSVRIVSGTDPYLFPVSGNNQIAISDKLISLEKLTAGPDSLKSISKIAYTKYYSADDRFVLSLLAGDRDQFDKELAHAKIGLSKAFSTGENWNSPNGSYFTSNPLGSAGVAFVYPGAFNSYPGMGRDLFLRDI